ncbi:MAG TPA: phospholipid carrier-dependent glycosyltransferase [Polyangiaceae bacterium]|nr:phospholipid carrier-dependent glycosyltransferase [Polyangiaceae bacterium]
MGAAWAAWRDTAQFLASPVGVLLICMLCLGVYLRFHALGYPPNFQFDEHHFVENARNYIHHQTDQNDHPPLGKLIMAFFMERLGDGPVGWRAAALTSGLLTIVLGAVAAARLFGRREAGWFAAALFAADGFLISYSRAALLDGFLATSSVAILVACSLPMGATAALLAGVVTGLAMGIKFSGVGLFLPSLLAVALSPRTLRSRVFLGAVVIVVGFAVYVASYAYGLSIAGHPAGLPAVAADTSRLLVHHADLTEMKNPATSGWITWVLPKRPIVLSYNVQAGKARVVTSLGNLAIWWAAMAVLFSVGAVLLWRGVRWALDRSAAVSSASVAPADFVVENGRSVLLVLAVATGYLAPWVLTHRDSYIYHFLPSYTALVLLLSGYVAWARPRRPLSVLVFAAVVLVVAGIYAPIWSAIPVSPRALQARLFLESWR